MRKFVGWLLCLSLVALPALATTWDEYRIVLKDGSWLTVKEKPELLEGEAHFRLPNGLLAIGERQLIDWRSTEAWNFQASYLRGVITTGVTPLNGEDPYGQMILAPRPETDEQAMQEFDWDEEGAALTERPSPPDPEAEMRERVAFLGGKLEALKQLQTNLRAQAERAHQKVRISELRRQAATLEEQIRTVRAEQAELILQLPKAPGN